MRKVASFVMAFVVGAGLGTIIYHWTNAGVKNAIETAWHS